MNVDVNPGPGYRKVTRQHWAPYSSPGYTYQVTSWERVK